MGEQSGTICVAPKNENDVKPEDGIRILECLVLRHNMDDQGCIYRFGRGDSRGGTRVRWEGD